MTARVQFWELEGLRHHVARAIQADGPEAGLKVHGGTLLLVVDELIERRATDQASRNRTEEPR